MSMGTRARLVSPAMKRRISAATSGRSASLTSAALNSAASGLEAPLQVERARAHRRRQLVQRHALAAALVQVPLRLLQPSVHARTVSALAPAFYPDFALSTYLREVRGSRRVRSATAA